MSETGSSSPAETPEEARRRLDVPLSPVARAALDAGLDDARRGQIARWADTETHVEKSAWVGARGQPAARSSRQPQLRAGPEPYLVLRTASAGHQLADLAANAGQAAHHPAVLAAVALLQADPDRPSLHAHPLTGATCSHGGTLFVAYAQSQAGVFRVLFCYPTNARGTILVVALAPHPSGPSYPLDIARILT
jgi:hypothetical protein